MSQSNAREMIAVVGMAGRFPGSPNVNAFWENLRRGVEGITVFTDEQLRALGVPPARLQAPNFVRAAPVLEGIDQFDAAFFGYAPSEARLLDPQQRVFLETAWHALEHAAVDPSTFPGAIGVFGGASLSTYLMFNVLPHPSYSDDENGFEAMISNDKDFLCTRVAYHFDLRGPGLDVQTGCSTSLVATHLACESLLNFESDVALAGGVSINMPQRTGYLYEPGGISSPDGHCRAFNARSEGTLFGSGVGVVVLKRLEDALADGDTVHAVLLSSAINNDGAQKVGFTAPSVGGQAEVIFRARSLADIPAESIEHVEAHGTGTRLGDPIEVAALTQAFGAETTSKQFCALGSVKTNIGHLDAAAGITGLIKSVLALEHRELPASLHCDQPNPAIDFPNTPFYVNTKTRPWPAKPHPRRAAVSSFGIGGTNAHAILQEAPAPSPSDPTRRTHQLLVLSARSEVALEAQTKQLREHLVANPDACLADVAHTLKRGRKRFEWRRSLVCANAEEAVKVLAKVSPETAFTVNRPQRERPVVFMFPGGGAQYVGMGRELYERETVFRETVDTCAHLLQPHLGSDLRAALYPSRIEAAHAEQLQGATWALPALFTVEYAVARQLLAWGIEPAVMVGHSLGEYTAACLAGVMSLEDALSIVVMRGKLFDELPAGAMLSVLAPEADLRPLLTEELSLAAVNGPSQCVVSGTVEAVDRLKNALDARDVDCQLLRIRVAAHSQMVEAIVPRFVAWLKTLELHPPQRPFMSNLTGELITPEQATSAEYWGRHLRSTVNFEKSVTALAAEDHAFLEVGPGTTLGLLVKTQLDRARAADVVNTISHPREPLPADRFLLQALGKLWALGASVDWKAFYGDERRRRIPLPGYPFQRERFWIDAQETSPKPGAATQKRRALDDWFYTPTWQQTPGRVLNRARLPSAEPWLLFVPEDARGHALVELLRSGGQDVIQVEKGERFEVTEQGFQINPGQGRDYESVFAALEKSDRRPARVLHLWSLLEAPDFARAQRYGYDSLIHLARAWPEGWKHPTDLWVVGRGMHRIAATDEVNPLQALVSGPCRTLPQESPHWRCYTVDAGDLPAAPFAEALVADVLARPEERVLGYRGSQRWRQNFSPVSLTEEGKPEWALREHGVYFITGGLGTVGMQWAEALARSHRARLVLMGRSAFPAREQWSELLATEPTSELAGKIRRLRAMEALGAQVHIAHGDTASEAQLRSALTQARQRFGALHGIIHAAGIVGGKAIKVLSDFEPSEREAQFGPKIHGTYQLSRVVPELGLDFVLLVSSTVALFGGVGLATYSSANAFLDAFVRSPDARGARWLSLNLDHLRVPSAAGVKTRVDEYSMELSESGEVLDRVLTRWPSEQLIVSLVDIDARWKEWVIEGGQKEGRPSGSASSGSVHPRPQLDTPYVAPSTPTEEAIARIWEQTFGISQIGVDDNFFHLGGDSLFAVRVTSKLRKELRVDLPVTSLYEALTIRAMAAAVERLHEPAPEVTVETERPVRRDDRRERLQQQRARRTIQGKNDHE